MHRGHTGAHPQFLAMPITTTVTAAATTTEIESFIRRMGSVQMTELMLELCDDHEAVRKRLLRLMLADDPKRLAAGFRKSLMVWLRSDTYLGYSQTRDFGLELEEWLGQVGRELLPLDPAAALELAETFIESDAHFFKRVDDSGGDVGDAIRAGCRLWLKAAAQCESPKEIWPARLEALASADEYGVRDALYRHANDLLGEPALRQLADQYTTRLRTAMANPAEPGRMPAGTYGASSTLALLAQALSDPDVHVGAVLTCNPEPTVQQMEGLAEEYLNCGRPADALPWLERPWATSDDSRQRLLATALGQLGRSVESASLLQGVFEKTLAVQDLSNWMSALLPAEQSQAAERARELALRHQDPVAAALVLVELGHHAQAESALLAEPGRIRGQEYFWLVPMAETLEAHDCRAGATAVYRALLEAMLERAYARAYGHAFRYWQRLEVIAAHKPDLSRIGMHEAYVAEVRRKHARKVSFWDYVSGKREVASDLEPDAVDDE